MDWSLKAGNVAVRDLKTGQNRLLTRDTAGQSAEYPVISPDGAFVAYGWFERDAYTIRTIRFDGTGTRVVTKHVALESTDGIVWSPDGRRLAIVVIEPVRTRQIALIDIASGALTQLISTGSRSPTVGGFSADGRRLVFSIAPVGTSPDDTNTDIYTIAVDGSGQTTLVQDPAHDWFPYWTPDNRAVVFLSDRSGAPGLWAIGVEHGKPIGTPFELKPNISSTATAGFSREVILPMGFSQTGAFFYGRRTNESDVYIAPVDLEGLRVSGPPARLSEHGTGTNSAPQWSPDGRYIAFLRGTTARTQTIVIRHVSDGVERTLPTEIQNAFPNMNHGFDWFPDGQSLLLRDMHPTRERVAVLRRIDVNTGKDHVLGEAGDWDIWPPVRVSRDGRSAFYTALAREEGSNSSYLRLMKRDLATGTETQLFGTKSGFYAFYGLLTSPDGERLAFLDNVESKPRTLVTMSVSGGRPTELYPTGGPAPQPTDNVGAWNRAWTPDGRFVITKTRDDAVWAVPADGGAPRKLDWPLPRVGWLSPDSKRTVYSVEYQQRELRTIENLLPLINAAR